MDPDEISAAIMPTMAASCSGLADRTRPEERRQQQLGVDEQEEHERAGQRRAGDVTQDARRQLGDVLRADRHERMGDAGGHGHRGDEQAEERHEAEQPRKRLLARRDRQVAEHVRITAIRRERAPHHHGDDAGHAHDEGDVKRLALQQRAIDHLERLVAKVRIGKQLAAAEHHAGHGE
jgi:hypothetical protein